MQFALLPQTSAPTGTDGRTQFEEMIAQCRMAIDGEFDVIRTSHKYLTSSYSRFQPVPILSHIASYLDDEALLTTFILPLAHPIHVAESFSTLNQQFDGTLYLSAIQGYDPFLFENFGVDEGARLGRFIESIQILRKLWTEDDVNFSGKHFELQNASINPKSRGERSIPIIIGANVEKSVKRAGRLGDGYHISTRTNPEKAAEFTNLYRSEKANSDRPDRGVVLNRMVYVGETTEQAIDDIRPMMISKIKSYQERGARDIIEEIKDIDEEVEALISEHIVGDPETCIEQVERFDRMIAPDILSCGHGWRELAHEKAMSSIELLNEEVIPHFR